MTAQYLVFAPPTSHLPLPLPPPPPASRLLQVRWTKTAGSASEKFQETSIFNETLRIERIQRVQGGRYYCKAENGVGVAAIKSIRVDVQCKSRSRDPSTSPKEKGSLFQK